MPVTNQVMPTPTLVALPSKPHPTKPQSGHRMRATNTTAIDYLTIIFETFIDQLFPSQGILLLDQSGRLIQSSPKARQLCQALCSHGTEHGPQLPSAIKTLVQHLIESRELFPNQPIQLQDDLRLENSVPIHLQAEWIYIDPQASSYIVVTLEDLAEVTHQRSLFDAYRYGFTPRETEVWELHLRGLSYREIAEECVITMNTVKRHMKSIHGKRREDLA